MKEHANTWTGATSTAWMWPVGGPPDGRSTPDHGPGVGVDLWRNVDQSGNSAEATLRNAVAEGVADRVEVQTGDMTALPFEDNSSDVVVSSLAIHNISGRAGR